jgi:hypothetical protein
MLFVKLPCQGGRLRLTVAHELAHFILHHHLGIPEDAADVEDEAWRDDGAVAVPVKQAKYLGGIVRRSVSDYGHSAFRHICSSRPCVK